MNEDLNDQSAIVLLTRMRRNMGGEIWEKLTPIIVSSSLSCWTYVPACVPPKSPF